MNKKHAANGRFREADYIFESIVTREWIESTPLTVEAVEELIKDALWDMHLGWVDFVHGNGGEPQYTEER